MEPEIHHRIHKNPPPVPTLSQINPVHDPPPPHLTSRRPILILSSHLLLEASFSTVQNLWYMN
jgi:hypothetical protein